MNNALTNIPPRIGQPVQYFPNGFDDLGGGNIFPGIIYAVYDDKDKPGTMLADVIVFTNNNILYRMGLSQGEDDIQSKQPAYMPLYSFPINFSDAMVKDIANEMIRLRDAADQPQASTTVVPEQNAIEALAGSTLTDTTAPAAQPEAAIAPGTDNENADAANKSYSGYRHSM